MHGRLRASARLRSALLAALFGGLFFIVPAVASTSDLTNFNLTETYSTYPTQYRVSTGGAAVEYRWLDSPSKDTVIAAIDCTDGFVLGSAQSIGSGNTAYHTLWGSGSSLYCFQVKGRTAAGQGSMNLHEGRVQR